LSIALLPVISQAGGMLAVPMGDTAVADAMPCHEVSEPGQVAADPGFPGCPHCAGDAPLAFCQCCAFALAALMPLADITSHVLADSGRVYRSPARTPLAEDPFERCFRPPIAAA
jgi:hypothetical protein